MVVHGQQPRPRALLEGLPDDVTDEIGRLFGSTRVVAPGEPVDESEYDVLVTAAAVTRSPRLHVLALGSPHLGTVDVDAPSASASSVDHGGTVTRGDPTHVRGSVWLVEDVLARQLDIPPQVTGSLRELVEDTLVPVIAAIDDLRPRWVASVAVGSGASSVRVRLSGPQALLTSHRADQVMAIVGRRHDRVGGQIVALPVIPESVSRWVRWFLERARDVDPAAFPVEIAWQDDLEWAPPAVSAALDEVDSMRRRRLELVAELDAAEEGARAGLAAARAAAEASVWRLVTEQGDALNAAVHEALIELGFAVTDSDAGRAENEPKMEDLRVSDTADPGWVGLAEVKGFTKGASPKGATQLMGRPVRAYVSENDRFPDSLWYVVNHLIETAPRQRPPALERDSIIDGLAEQGGALIDTRDLLRAVIAVRSSAVDPTAVRASMRTARGRWAWLPD